MVITNEQVSESDIRLLNKAIEEAKRSNHYRYYFGAVVAKNGKPVGMGMNQDITHPNSPHPYKKKHAEFNAIMHAMRRSDNLNGFCIYIARVSRTHSLLGDARPCIHCFSYIRQLGIRRIIFTKRDNSIGVSRI